MPQSMVAIEESQLGNGGIKYCQWAGFDYIVDWCAIFQVWSAVQAGYRLVNWQTVTSDLDVFPDPEAYFAGRILRFFNTNGRLRYSLAHGGNYTPVSGDIIGFSWTANPDLVELDHVGIVESCNNGIITTIEGNSSGAVRRRTYAVNDPDVICFGMMENSGTVLTVSDEVIAAMCGNFWRESTVNAGIWESLIVMPWDFVYDYTNKGGFGLGGFTNTYQSLTGLYDMRLERYHDWCVANGYNEDDGSATLYYIVFVERLWAGHYGNDDFDDFLNTTETDLYTLTDQWCTYWEGNPGDHMPERFSYAQQAYDYIQLHKNDDPSSYTWIKGNFYCSTDQSLNNVMCLYFWFKNYYTPSGGGNKPDGGWRKKLPIWMMLRNPNLY